VFLYIYVAIDYYKHTESSAYRLLKSTNEGCRVE
jgi:hypothetical protein